MKPHPSVVLDFSLLHYHLGVICPIKIISKALYLGKYLFSESLKQKPSVWIFLSYLGDISICTKE